MYSVLIEGERIERIIQPTEIEGFDIAPATIELAGAEIELVSTISREFRLKRAFESVQDKYDYILIDAPPSLGLLTVNGLTAANSVLVPIQCELRSGGSESAGKYHRYGSGTPQSRSGVGRRCDDDVRRSD